MHRLNTIFIVTIATLLMMGIGVSTSAQPHVDESLLVHLDLDLDKSAVSPTNVQVRVHATDGLSDQYFASPVDPDEDDTVEWNQDLPLTVDSNYSMRLIFHIADPNGGPIPAGYAVQWQYDLDGSGFQDTTGHAITIPAGSSGDMNLTIQGSVLAQ